VRNYVWRHVCRILLTIKQTPSLNSDPTYRSQNEDLLRFTEVNIFPGAMYGDNFRSVWCTGTLGAQSSAGVEVSTGTRRIAGQSLILFCSQLLTPPRLRVAGVNVGARCPEGASRDGRPGSELASRARLEALCVL